MKAMILLPLLALGLLCTTGAADSPCCGGSGDGTESLYKKEPPKGWLSPSNYKSFSSQANCPYDYCYHKRSCFAHSRPAGYYYTYPYPMGRYYTWYYFPYSYYKYPTGYFYGKAGYPLVIG